MCCIWLIITIFWKFKLFDFTLDVCPLTAFLFLVTVFFGSGGFIFFEDRFKEYGVRIYIWSTRLGLCFLNLFLVLFIRLDFMSFMTEVMLLFSAAVGVIFYINYNTYFWTTYGKLISQFKVANDDVKSKVCEALGLSKKAGSN